MVLPLTYRGATRQLFSQACPSGWQQRQGARMHITGPADSNKSVRIPASQIGLGATPSRCSLCCRSLIPYALPRMRQGANLMCLFDPRHVINTGAGAASKAKTSLDVMNTHPSKRNEMLIPARMRLNQAAGAIRVRVMLPCWSSVAQLAKVLPPCSLTCSCSRDSATATGRGCCRLPLACCAPARA